MSDLISRPFRPAEACERCIFGEGRHAEFCHLHVLPGCRCNLTRIERQRGEPHATECELAKKREAA